MNSAGDIFNTSQLHFEGDFESQVSNILYYVRLSADEVKALRRLCSDVEITLQTLAPGLKVRPFGSIVTGQGIKTSDVDCYIELPNGMQPNNNIVIHARNILKKQNKIFTNLFAITTAKVPIVKFLHIPTKCNCDINFKSPAGVQNSYLVSCLLQMDASDKILYLAVIIKYWSKIHKITGTNLLASYGLTLMVIFYLQLMNILPSIYELQQNVPEYIVDGWNMAFDRNMVTHCNSETLYELLGGFFKCYSNFDFAENVISPYMGRLLNRKIFKKLDDVPNEYVAYKKHVANNIYKPLRINTALCVQDPFEHNRIASATVNPNLAVKMNAHIQHAAKMFDELPSEQFLEAILVSDPNHTNKVKKKRTNVHLNKVMKHKNPPYRRGIQNSANSANCMRYHDHIRGWKRSRRGNRYGHDWA